MKNETPGFHFSSSSPLRITHKLGILNVIPTTLGTGTEKPWAVRISQLVWGIQQCKRQLVCPTGKPSRRRQLQSTLFQKSSDSVRKTGKMCPLASFFFFLIFIILFPERRTKHFCGFTSATTKIPPTLCPKVEDWAAGCTQQGKREEDARHQVKGLFRGCHGVSHHHHWRERRGKAADADMVEERWGEKIWTVVLVRKRTQQGNQAGVLYGAPGQFRLSLMGKVTIVTVLF